MALHYIPIDVLVRTILLSFLLLVSSFNSIPKTSSGTSCVLLDDNFVVRNFIANLVVFRWEMKMVSNYPIIYHINSMSSHVRNS
jgi:hypothetical protein